MLFHFIQNFRHGRRSILGNEVTWLGGLCLDPGLWFRLLGIVDHGGLMPLLTRNTMKLIVGLCLRLLLNMMFQFEASLSFLSKCIHRNVFCEHLRTTMSQS